MSVKFIALVWELELPDSLKIVALALADSANDSGNCWPGMRHLTKKTSKSERTVQGCIGKLKELGHLTVHYKPGKGNYYELHPQVVHETTPAEVAPRNSRGTPPQILRDTPASVAGHPRSPRPLTVIEPSRTVKEPPKIAHVLPMGWEPLQFGEGTQSRQIVDSWSVGELAIQVELFKAQHEKSDTKFVDWQKAWSTWVLNSLKFGVRDHARGQATGLGRTEAAARRALERPATPAR